MNEDKLLKEIDDTLKVHCVSSCIIDSIVKGKSLNKDTFINCLYTAVTDVSELIPHKTYIRYKIVYPDKEIYKAGGWFICKKKDVILVGNTPHSTEMKTGKTFKPRTYAIKTSYKDPTTNKIGVSLLYRKLTDDELIKKINGLQIALDSREQVIKNYKGI